MMQQFVVVLHVDEADLDGDESIENATRLANEAFPPHGAEMTTTPVVIPLSEMLPC